MVNGVPFDQVLASRIIRQILQLYFTSFIFHRYRWSDHWRGRDPSQILNKND